MTTVNQALTHYRNESIDVTDLNRLETAIIRLNDHFGDAPLSSVDVLACRSYREARREAYVVRHGELHKISDATIARELGVLKAASKCALKWKLITADKMPTFEIPDNLPKSEIWLHDNELRRLYVAAKNHGDMYMYVRLLYITASRRGAIEALEWSQIDFKRRIIHLNKPGQKVTKKRRPTIPMGELYEPLLEMFDKKVNNYVLGSKADRYKQFVRLLDESGLTEVPEHDGRPAGRVTPHTIRHTRATHLLEAGMSIYAVASLLGDNPTTVERVYAHACTSKLEEELNKFS